VPFGSLASEFHFVDGWSAQEISYKFKLLNRTLSLKKDTSTKEFSEDASDTPHIHGSGVVLGTHEDLWSSVILRDDLLRHVLTAVFFFDPG
jgi:hypothetical protein